MPGRAGRERRVGVASIRSALDRQEPIMLALVREDCARAEVRGIVDALRERGVPVVEQAEREMRRMSADDGPAELVALVGPAPDADLDPLMRRSGLVLGLVGLRFPGNVGFALRAAEVAGAAGVGVANGWSPGQREWREALRASIHAERFFPVVATEPRALVAAARGAGRRVVAVETNGDVTPWRLDWSVPSLVLLGGETDGLPPAMLERADVAVRIPTAGFIPSYNVQAAASILLGEWLRQTESMAGEGDR